MNNFNGGSVKFGNNDDAKIVKKGHVSLNSGKILCDNVLYVDGLKHNLLSVSQLCKDGHNVVFSDKGCVIKNIETGKQIGKGKRTSNNLYVLDEQNNDEYLLTRDDEAKLWHKRLDHICNKNLAKLYNWHGLRDLPDVK